MYYSTTHIFSIQAQERGKKTSLDGTVMIFLAVGLYDSLKQSSLT